MAYYFSVEQCLFLAGYESVDLQLECNAVYKGFDCRLSYIESWEEMQTYYLNKTKKWRDY